MNGTLSYHTPVLAEEILRLFLHRSSGVYLDGTVGGGGHFWAMAGMMDSAGVLIGIDRDPDAISWNREHRPECRPGVILEQERFAEFDLVLERHALSMLDGVFLDLGVSSRQIDSRDRGFTYMKDAPLDMRMDPTRGIPASELLDRASDDELAAILRDFGEVEKAPRIARGIKGCMRRHPITTSSELRECIAELFSGRVSIPLLAKIFQALRIAVNDELGELRRFLSKVINVLRPGARLAVISYHSLEDRMVKEFIRVNEGACRCPPESPVCRCDRSPLLRRLTKKAIRPSDQEVTRNPRSRSARLRIAERTEVVR